MDEKTKKTKNEFEFEVFVESEIPNFLSKFDVEFEVRSSKFDVRSSKFDVRCSMFEVEFEVRCSMLSQNFIPYDDSK